MHFPEDKASETHDPFINRSFRDDQIIAQIAASTHGSAFRLTDGQLLLCGHSHARALRLEPEITIKLPGHGGFEYRINPDLALPRPVPSLMRQFVTYVSCGMNHCAAVTKEGGIHTWGEGSGGRLGHGNNRSVHEPKRIDSMKNDICLSVECSAWFTFAIVLVPPLTGNAGWVFSWGSGYKGQLGHNKEVLVYKPKPIETFLEKRKLINYLAVGLNHVAAITSDYEVWSWGSNFGGALGRPNSIDESDNMDDFYGWTGIPGKCEGFDAWGKGYPASVACSRHATVVALHPWHGVDEATWLEEKEMEEELKKEEIARRKEEAKELERRRKKEREENRVQTIKQLNRYHPICSICSNAPPFTKCYGFYPDSTRPMQCGNCGHERAQHRATRDEKDTDKWPASIIEAQAKKLEKKLAERDGAKK